MTKRKAPPIDDHPESKADWDDMVSQPDHTNAIVKVMDNRLPPLVKNQKETEDQRTVKKWFGVAIAAKNRVFDDVAACKYLEYYSRSGRKADAAIYAGVTIATINSWEGVNVEFRDLGDEAHHLYLSMLEREMLRRGVTGVLKPIVAGKDPEIVTYERQFSDKLLEMLARKADPVGYGGRDSVNVNVHAGVLVAPGGVTEENTPLPIEDVEDEDDVA